MLAEARGYQRRRKQISKGPKTLLKLSLRQFCLTTFYVSSECCCHYF